MDKITIPEHIAIIMDGNGRWAKKRGLPRVKGHYEGAKGVRGIVESCSDIGVKYLTL
ncbi:MAG: undecaprenyl diphosphate synthase family protein, partial [Candidatus Aureabacteria bacterium]|nr:undecaprenyl diphosphate synthase family protein [Candidatus Auribacterota bacterium]